MSMEQQSVAEFLSFGFLALAAAIGKLIASASFGVTHIVGNPAVAVAFLLGAFPSFSSPRVREIAVLASALTLLGYGEIWAFEPWLNLGLNSLLGFQPEAAALAVLGYLLLGAALRNATESRQSARSRSRQFVGTAIVVIAAVLSTTGTCAVLLANTWHAGRDWVPVVAGAAGPLAIVLSFRLGRMTASARGVRDLPRWRPTVSWLGFAYLACQVVALANEYSWNVSFAEHRRLVPEWSRGLVWWSMLFGRP